MSTRHNKRKSFSREEGLFKIRDNRHKGFQLHLIGYVLKNKCPFCSHFAEAATGSVL